MKTIIAGSRSITNYLLLDHLIQNECPWSITEVVCGCADGVDQLGFKWARDHNIPIIFFPGWANQKNWALRNRRDGEHVQEHFGMHGKFAGHMRNGQMALYADALILIWDGYSRGSADMLRRAETLKRQIVVREHQP